ncbi:hypothetical protein BC828DRAFT_398151 [Blastocladiella britannica]|nr:hypothetical protein BC828DRAFT_398151 [Blastocladiella britannica]
MLPVVLSAAAGAAFSTAAWIMSATPPSARSSATSSRRRLAAVSSQPPANNDDEEESNDNPLHTGPSPAAVALRATADELAGGPSTSSTTDVVTTTSATDRSTESQNLLSLLYSVAEDQARKDGFIHRGITCNHCGTSPVRGVRFKCSNCVDFDVCESCEAQEVHTRTHVFLKIRIPIPPLANPRTTLLNPFYPGNRPSGDTLATDASRTLQSLTHFDALELDALYEQYKALATNDKGIPRGVYEQSLGPLGLEKNLITDRVWYFFDADKNGFISFAEMAKGLSVLCKGTLDEKIDAAFKGYDLNGDGRITRDELHAMFKAYFHLSMELVRDVVKAMEEEMMEGFDDSTNKPVSAAFTAPIPANAVSRPGEDAPAASSSPGSRRTPAAGGAAGPGAGGDWEKGDDPDAHASPLSALPSRNSSLIPGSAASVAASAQQPPRALLGGATVEDPDEDADDEHHHHHGDAGQLSSVPATPLGSAFPGSGIFGAPGSATGGVHPALAMAAAARRSGTALLAPAAAARVMSLDVGALGGHGAGAANGGDRLQPIMEQMSQEAIAEMVDKTFLGIDVEGRGWLAFDDFKAYVEADPTLISWFETMGSVW